MTEALREVYLDAGLLTADGPSAAHLKCSCASRCWEGEGPDRVPASAPPSRAQGYRPWVGAHFDDTRLLIVGENFHDHGGWDEANGLVRWCIPALQSGRRRMNFDNPRYAGSLFQHRAAVYASAWLAAHGHGAIPVGEVYNHLAFTNAVKCSPQATPNVRSTPNAVMWAECPRLLLAAEVAVLGVRRILVLGTSSNSRAVRAQVWPGLKSVSELGRVALWRDSAGHEALVVPHPAGRGGAKRAIEDEVRAVVRQGSAAQPGDDNAP